MKTLIGRLSVTAGVARKISRTFAMLSALGLAGACLPASAAVVTNTFDLGPAGTGTFFAIDTYIPWIAQGTLPTGSILRSVAINATLEWTDNLNLAADLMVLVSPDNNNILLTIGTSYGSFGGAQESYWANGYSGPVSSVIDTKTAGVDWMTNVDLSTNDLVLLDAIDGDPPGTGSYWSGTVSVTYDVPGTLAEIITFTFPGAKVTTIDQGTLAIHVTVPADTDVSSVAPVYTMSILATGTPVSATARNFTTPQTYTIVSGDHSATNVYTVTVVQLPPPVASGLVCWYAAGSGVTTNGSGVQTWKDISGNAHDATRGNGTITLVTNQVNSLPALHLRGNNTFLNCAVAFSSIVKEEYLVVRSPHANWNSGGSFLGRQGTGNSPARCSSYNMYPDGTSTGFWQDHFPVAVSKNGTPVSSDAGPGNNPPRFMLVTITNFMLLKIVVDDTADAANLAAYPYYQIGRNDNLGTMDFDVAEIIGFDHALSSNDEAAVGGYLASKYAISTSYPLPGPIMSFTATPTDGNAPLAVTFTDTSIPNLGPIYNRHWIFGDGGSANSASVNVTHTYTSTGTYTVVLTDSDTAGAFGTLTQSNLIVVTTLPAPGNLTAQPLNARVHLSWSPVSPPPDGYLLSRSNGTSVVTFPPLATTTYLDTGVTNGTEYWYAVAATNSAGLSPMSEWVLAVPLPSTPPSFLPGSGISHVDSITGNATITLGVTSNWYYRIVYKDDLLAGEWLPVQPPTDGWHFITNTGTMTLTDTNTAGGITQRFYRIEVQ